MYGNGLLSKGIDYPYKFFSLFTFTPNDPFRKRRDNITKLYPELHFIFNIFIIFKIILNYIKLLKTHVYY